MSHDVLMSRPLPMSQCARPAVFEGFKNNSVRITLTLKKRFERVQRERRINQSLVVRPRGLWETKLSSGGYYCGFSGIA